MSINVKRQLTEMLPRLRRFARALTGSTFDADDLVQSTCERVLIKHHQFQPGTQFDHWVFRVSRNLWIDLKRQQNRQGISHNEDELHESERPVIEGQQETSVDLYAVDKAMQQLPEEQRTLLVLVCVEGFAYKEAAEVLELPVGTVMSRLARARKRLMELMNDGQ